MTHYHYCSHDNDYPFIPAVTTAQLQAIAPVSVKAASTFLPHILRYAPDYALNTVARMAMFLAQVLHESACFRYTRELWGPTAQQKRYERDFKEPWPPVPERNRNQLAYRLGNMGAGDGAYFKGHGLIQVTGRANHLACSKALFGDDRLLRMPELLTTPQYAVLSAFWYWDSRHLNELSHDIVAATRKINGGTNGLEERKLYYERGLEVLG